jgi:tetratricopeptide (TPR) repeat protein
LKNKFHLLYIPLLILAGNSVLAQNPTIDSLKRVLQVVKIDTAKVNTYNALANEYRESNPDLTAFYAEKASGLSQQIHYGFGVANALMNKGNSNVILSNYPQARKDFNAAQRQFESLLSSASDSDANKNKNGLARAYASAGVVYSEENNYSEALEKYFKALKIYQEIGQTSSISKVYNNIGIVYKSQENLPKALDYFLKALKIQQQTGEQTVAVTLTNIGAIYFEQAKSADAFRYYSKAASLFEKIDNQRGNALLHSYLGDYYSKQNDAEKALEYYNKSLKLYEDLDNKFGAALALYNIGQLYTNQKKYAEALPYATKSLNMAKEIGVLDQTTQSERLLSEIYGFLNRPAESLAHYKQYIIVKDSLDNEADNKKILRAEMNFEYQKKEALLLETNKRQHQLALFIVIGIVLLLGLIFVTYNRLQIKRRLTLQKEVAEYEQKALHLQMNPHFVFNCLGSISSFIVQNGTDSAIKYLSKFSKLMRLTLEYSKGSLIPIDKEIESLQNYLELEQLRFNKIFDFSIQQGDAIEDDMALPPLLIQPFVENAILHGVVPKETQGKIDISFDVIDNELVCTIADNGIGFIKSNALKENSFNAHQSRAL